LISFRKQRISAALHRLFPAKQYITERDEKISVEESMISVGEQQIPVGLVETSWSGEESCSLRADYF